MGSTPIAGTRLVYIRRKITMFKDGSLLTTIIPIGVFFAIMYFFLIRPQKKKEKEIKAMRENVHVGDEIVTIGGIIGKIVKTTDETFVLQVGADKLKFEFYRWAVSKVLSSDELAAMKTGATTTAAEKPKKRAPRKLGKKKAEETAPEVDPAQEEGK